MAINVNEEFLDFDYGLFVSICEQELFVIPQLTASQEVEFSLGLSTEANEMSRGRHWCFTLNNYTDDDIERLNALDQEVDYLIYGKEVGASGTPHLQGFVTFRTRIRRRSAIEKIGQAHFSIARNIDQAIEYCKKEGDFVEVGNRPRGQGSRSDLDDFKAAVVGGEHDMVVLRSKFSEVVARFPKFCVDFLQDNLPKKIVELHPLKDWQSQLYNDLQRQADDRKIIFIIDFMGNTGKSWFSHYYCHHHSNAQVMLPGKKADMAYMLNPLIRVLFIDAPRSKQGDYLQYDFLEDVKNGFVFSTKYECRVKQLQKVHVVVMMNEEPDRTKLSEDRFDIRRVN